MDVVNSGHNSSSNASDICFVEGRDPLRSAFDIFSHFICCSHMLTRKVANGAVNCYHSAFTFQKIAPQAEPQNE